MVGRLRIRTFSTHSTKNFQMSILNQMIACLVLIGTISCAGTDKEEFIDKSVIPEGKQTSTFNQSTPDSNIRQQNIVVPNGNTVTIPGTTPTINNVTLSAQQETNASRNAQIVTNPQTATTQKTGDIKLNPAHGQPGHRCDIAVGAPLNSPPGSSVSKPQVVTTQQQPTQTVTTNASQQTAPGMNPPHGQPGHRCDIAVGAPLNSKPVQGATTNTSTNVPTIVSTVTADTSKN